MVNVKGPSQKAVWSSSRAVHAFKVSHKLFLSQNITNYLTQTLAYTDLVLVLFYLEGLTMFDHLSLDVYLYQLPNEKTLIKWPSLAKNSTRFKLIIIHFSYTAKQSC